LHQKSWISEWRVLLLTALRRAHYRGHKKLKPGIRSLAGILFIIGGVFGFLPILEFWMIPVGLLLIALDIPALRQLLRRWLLKRKQQLR
jgi:hypothetical protein